MPMRVKDLDMIYELETKSYDFPSYPETHILNLTVSSQFRNNGIGSSLIQLIINDARIRNSQDIILEVRSSNKKAQSLYKKLLFKQIGLRKDYYDSNEGREDAYVLKLEL